MRIWRSGKIVHQLLKNGDGGIIFIADAENQLVIRVILAAVAGKILVGFRIQARTGFRLLTGGVKSTFISGPFSVGEKKGGNCKERANSR